MANSCPDGRWSAGNVPALLLARRVKREARGGACFCPFRSGAVGRRRGRQAGPKAVSEARTGRCITSGHTFGSLCGNSGGHSLPRRQAASKGFPDTQTFRHRSHAKRRASLRTARFDEISPVRMGTKMVLTKAN